MPSNDKKFDLSTLVLAGLAAFMLPVTGNALLMWKNQALIHRELEALGEKIEAATEHDATVSKFWKLHSWSRHQIHELQVGASVPMAPWPELTVEGE